MRALTEPQRRLLGQIAGGARLMDHRDIEGGKRFTLAMDEGEAVAINPAWVEGLVERGLIASNLKFPGATYWLTATGKQLAAQLAATRRGPLNT